MKTQKTIVDTNLYLGSQLDMPNDEKLFYLRTTDIYFYLFNSMSKYKNFKLYKNQLILNLKDPFFIDQINFNAIVAGIKFLKNRDLENEMYVHCQRGVSRSASIIFIYLVISKKIKNENFDSALKNFYCIYKYVSLNYGIYKFLKTFFPFTKINHLSNLTYEQIDQLKEKDYV